jgi:hypothetical protein
MAALEAYELTASKQGIMGDTAHGDELIVE